MIHAESTVTESVPVVKALTSMPSAKGKTTATFDGNNNSGTAQASTPDSNNSAVQASTPNNTRTVAHDDQDASTKGASLWAIVIGGVAVCALGTAIAITMHRNKQRGHAGLDDIDEDISTQHTTELFHNPMFTTPSTAVADATVDDRSIDDFAVMDNALEESHTHQHSSHDNAATMLNDVCISSLANDDGVASPVNSNARRSTQRRSGMESTVLNTVYVSSGMGNSAFEGCLYAIPTETSNSASHSGMPYETPIDEPDGYKMLTDADGNDAQGYDGELTCAGHYAEGHNGQLTMGTGYDGQLTDPDYAMLRSRAERSTQRRPAEVSTVENVVYSGTSVRAPAQTMVNAVYAVPMDTDVSGEIHTAPSGMDAPTYGAVHDFQNQVSRARTTHVVDDVAYVATHVVHSYAADYSEPADALHREEGVYSDMYAQEAVNPHALSNYVHMMVKDPVIQAVTSTNSGEEHVDTLPTSTTAVITDPETDTHMTSLQANPSYVSEDALQEQVQGVRADTVCVQQPAGYQIPLETNGGAHSDTATSSNVRTCIGYVMETPAHQQVGMRGIDLVSNGDDANLDGRWAKDIALDHSKMHTAQTLSATALPPTMALLKVPTQAQLIQAWLRRDTTGSQAENDLRSCPEGHFCVRKSASTAECIVLSLMGPSSIVYHYQFKAVAGGVQIHRSRKNRTDPTFSSHSECLDFYLANAVSTTGLATRPVVCISLPRTHSQRHGIQFSGGVSFGTNSAIDC